MWRESCEKGSKLGPILKGESTRFADVLNGSNERKRGIKDNSKVLAANNWKMPLAETVTPERSTFQREKHGKSLCCSLYILIHISCSHSDVGVRISREKLGQALYVSYVVFLLPFISKYFLVFSVISWTHHLFERCVFRSLMFVNFSYWFLVSFHYNQKECFVRFQYCQTH